MQPLFSQSCNILPFAQIRALLRTALNGPPLSPEVWVWLSDMDERYSQAGRPSGLLGRVLGKIMAWYNQPDNQWTLDLLGLSGGEKILEIGYGPGQAIQMASALCPKCQIVGIDHSDAMLAAASRLNKKALAAGTVALSLGDVAALEFAEASFDKVFSINCVYFWPDSARSFEELHRVLKTGGKLAITVRDKKRQAYRPFNRDNLKKMLSQAGFSQVEIHSNGIASHPLLCGIAIK